MAHKKTHLELHAITAKSFMKLLDRAKYSPQSLKHPSNKSPQYA